MLKMMKTTVTGGLIFLLPIAVLLFILGRIISTVTTAFEPLAGKLPVSSVGGVSAAIVLAVIGLLLVSFLAGLLAQTHLARHATKELEDRLLGRIPAYGILKSLGTDLVAPQAGGDYPVVLVQFDDAWQVAIRIGVVPEAGHTVIFLPDSPTPQSGTVMVVATSWVHVADVPLSKAFAALSVRGVGLAELLQAPAAALLNGPSVTGARSPGAVPA